jgi:hypothetical protein
MNRKCILCSATLIWQSAMPAWQIPGAPQNPGGQQSGIMSFQSAETLAAGRGSRSVGFPMLRPEKGRPFSAKITTQTVQTFFDGTHVSQSTTMLEYRDAEGRVRTETSHQTNPPVVVTIRDPVGGVIYRLNPPAKTFIRTEIAISEPRGRQDTFEPGAASGANMIHTTVIHDPNSIVEDLGVTPINGIQAHGTRITTIVPSGAIGNDREFRSVDEHWFSSDLNLLIKSINTDPRFGTTTYELTNISRQAPDPALFQPPADYSPQLNRGRGR